jgi:D-arabinose 1-dehydrogenase-like Zn-dependent alcohol dehydrogenase
VNTVSAKIDLDAFLGLLAVHGTLVNVGAPAEPLSVNGRHDIVAMNRRACALYAPILANPRRPANTTR